jgi:hypothetical protein
MAKIIHKMLRAYDGIVRYAGDTGAEVPHGSVDEVSQSGRQSRRKPFGTKRYLF